MTFTRQTRCAHFHNTFQIEIYSLLHFHMFTKHWYKLKLKLLIFVKIARNRSNLQLLWLRLFLMLFLKKLSRKKGSFLLKVGAVVTQILLPQLAKNILILLKNNASKKADLKLKIKNVRGLCKWVNLLLTMRFSKRRQSVSFEKLIQLNRHTFVMLVSRDVTIDQLWDLKQQENQSLVRVMLTWNTPRTPTRSTRQRQKEKEQK